MWFSLKTETLTEISDKTENSEQKSEIVHLTSKKFKPSGTDQDEIKCEKSQVIEQMILMNFDQKQMKLKLDLHKELQRKF